MSRILVAGTRSELPIQITNLPWNLLIFIRRFGEKQNKPKQSTPESDRISRSLHRIFAEFDSWTLLYGEVTLKLPPESFRWKPQHDLNFPRSATPIHPYICTTFTVAFTANATISSFGTCQVQGLHAKHRKTSKAFNPRFWSVKSWEKCPQTLQPILLCIMYMWMYV